jgi:hypothetical protein
VTEANIRREVRSFVFIRLIYYTIVCIAQVYLTLVMLRRQDSHNQRHPVHYLFSDAL